MVWFEKGFSIRCFKHIVVWGPLLPSPVIRTRDVVAIQSRQRVRCRCRSRWHYAICAIFLTTHLVFFTIVTSSFWPSLWSKILNVTSLKQMLPNDLEISCKQLLVATWHKRALGPIRNWSSPPWAWCTTALTITPPCQLLNSHTFFILPLWNQRKRARGPAGNGSSPFSLRAPPLHHRDFSIYLILFFHSWANLL